jgi:hypothetical protein
MKAFANCIRGRLPAWSRTWVAAAGVPLLSSSAGTMSVQHAITVALPGGESLSMLTFDASVTVPGGTLLDTASVNIAQNLARHFMRGSRRCGQRPLMLEGPPLGISGNSSTVRCVPTGGGREPSYRLRFA